MKKAYLSEIAYISEIFVSIQGEGPYSGVPAVFVRFGLCNFTCPGFGPNGCDSNFSVDTKNKSSWTAYTVDQLYDKIVEVLPEKCNLVVLTGGEPMIYKLFVSTLIRNFKYFKKPIFWNIETNGYLGPLTVDYLDLPDITYSISPKLKSAGNKYSLLHTNYRKTLKEFDKWFINKQFKFVVGSQQDLDEINEFVKVSMTPLSIVSLMPKGSTKEELKQTEKFVWDACIKHGYKFCDRTHIRLFDDKRGV